MERSKVKEAKLKKKDKQKKVSDHYERCTIEGS